MTTVDVSEPPRARMRSVWNVALLASMACAAAAVIETEVVRSAWRACHQITIGLDFFVLPLWLFQTLVITAGSPVLMLLSRRRRVVGAAIGLFSCVVVISVAWAFFAFAGLPTNDLGCPGTMPAWWPRWLPPKP